MLYMYMLAIHEEALQLVIRQNISGQQTTAMSHQAAWIKTKHANLEVGPAETPTPGPLELLVQVKVIAFSPIESKLQR